MFTYQDFILYVNLIALELLVRSLSCQTGSDLWPCA